MRVTGGTFPLLHVPSRRAQVRRDRPCYGTVRLVAILSLRRTGFEPTHFQVGIMLDNVTLGQIFLRALRLSPVINGVPREGLGDSNPPRNSEVLTKSNRTAN